MIGPTGVDDLFTGILDFPGGVHGLVDCGLRLPFRAAIEALGTEGSAIVDDPWLCSRPGIELRRGDRVERVEVDVADSYRLELEDFALAIAGEREPLLARADAVAQARVLGAPCAARRPRRPAQSPSTSNSLLLVQGLSLEVLTTRKSEPFTRWSVWSWSLSQPGSGAPEMYQLEPLSATIIP